MKTEAEGGDARKDEAELCRRLEPHFERLAEAGRCEWRKEVRMLHWRHAADDTRRVIRADYIVRLDNGPLIAVEAKVAPKRAAQLGNFFKQCADYSHSIIAANHHTPMEWTGRPVKATFLAVEIGTEDDYIQRHRAEMVRLGSAFRVGFIRRHRWNGLQLMLSDENSWWSERWGYRADHETRNSQWRVGSGTYKAPADQPSDGSGWWLTP